LHFVITGFANAATRDVFNGDDTKAARLLPKSLWSVIRRKLDMLNAATNLLDLRVPPNNRLEALKGSRKGKHSIRVNDQFRVVFTWKDGAASEVQVLDYH
jgi:proteic killer suppression protein